MGDIEIKMIEHTPLVIAKKKIFVLENNGEEI